MKWDQIESKWALMTRRLRADFGDRQGGAPELTVQALARHDILTSSIADSQRSAVRTPEFKTSAQ